MSLKQKIEEILLREHYTFSELADYLKLSEAELATALDNRTLELRYLEEISKALKVPLYSFFRTANYQVDLTEKPYYTNKLWATPEEQDPQRLQEEISLLRKALAQKEEALKKWKP